MKNSSLRTGDYITDVLMRTEAAVIDIIMLQVKNKKSTILYSRWLVISMPSSFNLCLFFL